MTRRPGGVALLIGFSLALQLAIHAAIGIGPEWPGLKPQTSPHSVRAGVLSNAVDNDVYAAFVAQAGTGAWLLRDPYTNEPQRPALLNPYFLLCGWLAGLTGLLPLTLLNLLSLAAAPCLGWALTRICGVLGLGRRATLAAVALALFGTGLSVLLKLGNSCFPLFGTAVRWSEGIDRGYYDLFPATAMLTLPYHAASWVFTAGVALLCLLALTQAAPRARHWRLAGAACALAALVLVRPYQAAGLALYFPAAWVLTRSRARRPVSGWLADGAIYAVFMGPVLVYVAWTAHLDVWRDVSKGYLSIAPTRWQIVAGFGPFWLLALSGVRRAWRTGDQRYALFGVWTVATMAVTMLLGDRAVKFSDGAVIAYAPLAAYAIQGWLEQAAVGAAKGKWPGNSLKVKSAAIACCLMFATTIVDCLSLLHGAPPVLPRELLVAARLLRPLVDGTPAMVLTDCASGNVVPALSAVSVYAGHWAFTLDYAGKCAAIAQAGLDANARAEAHEASFRVLLGTLQPRYVWLRQDAPADAWISRIGGSARLFHGRAWDLYELPAAGHGIVPPQGAASG